MKTTSLFFRNKHLFHSLQPSCDEVTLRTINSSPAPGGYGYRCTTYENIRVVPGFRVCYDHPSRHLTSGRPRTDYQNYREHHFLCEGSLCNGMVQMTHRGHCSPTREERVEKYLARFTPGEKVLPSVVAKDLNIHVRKVGHVLSYLDCVERQFTRDKQHAIWVRV